MCESAQLHDGKSHLQPELTTAASGTGPTPPLRVSSDPNLFLRPGFMSVIIYVELMHVAAFM